MSDFECCPGFSPFLGMMEYNCCGVEEHCNEEDDFQLTTSEKNKLSLAKVCQITC